jgi:hypothetical protein
VVLVDGNLVANRARVAFVKDRDLLARGVPRVELHPDDLTDEVTTLLQLCRNWGTNKPAPVVNVRGLIAEWTDTDLTTGDTGNGGRAGTAAPVTTSPTAGGIPAPRPATGGRGGRPDGRLRQLVLTHVLAHAGITRAQARDHAIELGFSSSGAYKEINQLLEDGAIREDAQGRLIATIWDHQAPVAAGGA